jgi:hypothetical protein
MRFMPAISINRKMLWDHYRTHRAEYTFDKKVQMQIIAAPFKAFLAAGVTRPSKAELAAARQAARETIDKARAALTGGGDFGETARELSKGIKAAEGGLWPLMPAESFRETKVEQAAFRLEEGQASGVIETETGFYVVKAKKVKPGRVVSFEDAQEGIEGKLRDEQFRTLSGDYYRKLMEGATVVRADEFMRVVLDQAVERYWRK